MDNINISLGVELDKQQFNEKYIQEQVDKHTGDIKLKVGKVEVEDVSKELQSNINKQASDVTMTVKDVKIAPIKLEAKQLKAITDLVEEAGLDTGKGFTQSLIEGIKQGDLEGASKMLQGAMEEFVSDKYKEAAREQGSYILKQYDEIVKRLKDSFNGYKINISDALLSKEEEADLKKNFGRVFTLVKEGGVKLGDVIHEVEDMLNSFGINIETGKLQDALRDLSNIVSERRTLKADKTALPSELVNIGFNVDEYYNEIEEKYTKLINKIANTEGTIGTSIDQKAFEGAIRNADVLEARLNEIKRTATEVSDIKYRFDFDGNLASALVTYKDESGKVLNEMLGWEVALNSVGEEVPVFTSRLLSAKEEFISITSEANKLSGALDKVKGNGLIDEARIKQAEDGISNLVNNINQIDTNKARVEVEALKNEISAIALADSLMVKLDSKTDLRNAMGIDTKGLDEIREKIQTISADTPVREIERIKTAISRIGTGNNQIIALTTTLENAASGVEKFKDISTGTEMENLINQMEQAESTIVDLEKGSLVAAEKVKGLQKAINDSLSDLEKVGKNQIIVSLKIDKLEEQGFLDKSVITELRDELSRMNTKNVDEMFKSMSAEIDKLGSRKGEIDKINNAIASTERELSKLSDKNVDIFNSKDVQESVQNVSKVASELERLKSDLSSGKAVDFGDIATTIHQLSVAESILKSTVDTQNKLNNLIEKQSQLRKSLQGLAGFIDASEMKSVEKSINNMSIDTLDKDFKAINERIKEFGKSENQLTRVNKVLQDMESKMSTLQRSSGFAWGSNASTSGIENVTNKLKELISIRAKLESGESVNSNNLVSTINSLNSAYGDLNSTITTIISNQSKVDSLQSKLVDSLQTRTALGVDTTYIEKLIDSLNGIDVSSEDARLEIEKLANSINGLGSADSQILKIQETIKKLKSEISNITGGRSISELVDNEDIEKVSALESELEKLEDVFKGVQDGSKYTNVEIQKMCNDAKNSMKELSSAADDVGDVFSGLGSAINKGMEVALGFEFVGLLKDQISQMKGEIMSLDSEMVSLKRVSDETSDTYKALAKDANTTAVAMGKTTQEVVYATAEFVKMGYSIEESSDSLSKAALTLSNVADMDIDAAVSAIVSTMKGLGLEAEMAMEIVDVINEAGNKYALESSDLAEGIRIGAASLSIAGNDLYQTAALITAGTEVLQDANKVSNGLRTIAMRLRGISEEGDELNPKLGELVKTLTGVDLTDVNGEFRSTYDIISGIAAQWDKLNSKQQAILLEEVAGKNQANVLASILKNSQSLTDAYGDLSDAAGSAMEEQKAYMDSIAGSVNALKENVKGIFFDMIDEGAVAGTLDSINGLVTGFRKLTDVFGSLPSVVAAGVLAFTSFNEQGRKMASVIGDITPGVRKLSITIDDYTERLKKKADGIRSDIESTKRSIEANKKNGQSVSKLSTELVGYNSKLAQTKILMAGVQVVATAMNAAISMGISLLAGFALQKVLEFADGLITTKEKLNELNQEFSSTFGEKANVSSLVEQYKTLSEELRNTSRGTEQYNDTSKKLAAVESELVKLYPKINEQIAKNGDLKWKNVEAIEAVTEAELEAAKAQARVVLGENKASDKSDIEKEIERYKKLIKQREEYSKEFDKGYDRVATIVTPDGQILSTQKTTKALKDVNEEIEQSKTKLSALYTALQTLGSDATPQFNGSLELLAETLGITEEELSQVLQGVDDLGGKFDEAAASVDKLSDAFGDMLKPLKLLNTMIEELEKYGGLTDKTYEAVLTSGNSQLIALLSDSSTALANARALKEQMDNTVGDMAKNLIDTAVKEQEAFQDVAESAGEMADAVSESMEQQTNAITNAVEEQAEAVSESVKNTSTNQLRDEYDGLIATVLESLNLTGVAARNMESVILESIKNYVDQGNELYTQDLNNNISALEAKNMASEMWSNEEIQRLAQNVLLFKDQYDADVVNWANDVVSKQAENKVYTDSVLNQIGEMVISNSKNYSIDTINWANAIQGKSENNAKMVNNITKNIAQMILSNGKNYSDDTVNWANAITNKSTNNADFCNKITNGMSDVINNLATQYKTDDENFANLMSSKKKSLGDFLKASLVEARFGNLPSFKDFLDKTKKPSNSGDGGGFDNSRVVGTYQAKPVSPVQVTGGNYVSNVGNPEKDKKKDKEKKDVADLEKLSDRYYAVNNALKKVENQLKAVDTELSSATGKDRIPLLEKEVKLLNDKRVALINVRNEQQRELAELRRTLSGKGFAFGADGQISNYTQVVDRLVADANSKTGEAKELAIKNVKEVVKQLNTYTDLLLKDIPDITNQINSITGSVSGIREEIEDIIKQTTFFTKDFADRYYDLNNALQQVENQLNSISVAMKNADDNRMVELLDKQIEMYIKQGEALAAIRKENVAELKELERELAGAGFKFNEDGTLSNYQALIDKMVKEANKITDGKKQEKAIERIEELMEAIEKYTDLLLTDIPKITDEMDDLANAVIDSQKDISDVLAKQRDEYIDNLKKETDALKKEIERRKDILKKQWEQEDAADELAEKQKALNELEDELTIALKTGDEKLIKNIRDQIANAQKEINNFIRDQERDYISDRFDKDLEKLDEDLEQKIEGINEKLSDKELLNLVQSGVRDLTGVLNDIEKGSKGVRTAFTSIGTTISETWIGALDTFVDKLNSLSDINLGLNIKSGLAKSIDSLGRTLNITQGNLIVQGNITEDILPVVQNMITVANNNLINDINAAFSR